ncbi:MAG: terminase small subunit [Chthoniobacteraceae bacterium]
MQLSGPRKLFAEGIASGLNATEAYRAGYAKSSPAAARAHGARLVANGDVQAEVERLRAKAEEKGGSAVMTLLQKRMLLAEIVRSPDDMFRGHKLRTSDRIAAINLDHELAGGVPLTGEKSVITVVIGGNDA